MDYLNNGNSPHDFPKPLTKNSLSNIQCINPKAIKFCFFRKKKVTKNQSGHFLKI